MAKHRNLTLYLGAVAESTLYIKEVFSEKSCFKNFAHPLSEGENIKK